MHNILTLPTCILSRTANKRFVRLTSSQIQNSSHLVSAGIFAGFPESCWALVTSIPLRLFLVVSSQIVKHTVGLPKWPSTGGNLQAFDVQFSFVSSIRRDERPRRPLWRVFLLHQCSTWIQTVFAFYFPGVFVRLSVKHAALTRPLVSTDTWCVLAYKYGQYSIE